MEEKKVTKKEETKREVKKLSYEELENAAKQITVQAQNVAKENQQLRVALQQASLTNMYTELNFKFKVLEFASAFSPEFVDKCVKSIEETMTPAPEEEESNDKE